MSITIQNRTARTDTTGQIIDCHDGCLQFFNGRYYHYGTRYGTENGYTPKNRFVCYSSPDLLTWTNHGQLLPNLPDAIYFRPYVRRNPRTGLYALWFNAYDRWKGTTNWAAGDGPTPGFYSVATAAQPQGPFHIVHPRVNIPEGVGDFNLFVDDDGTGYIIFTRIKNNGVMVYFQMTVEQMADDFLSVTGNRSAIIDKEVEAPALFKHGSFYYALMGHPCCFCPNGADVRVFRSRSPLGPYELRGNLNVPPHLKTAEINSHTQRYTIAGQTTDITTLHTPTGIVHCWFADRWESAADGIKGHDLQYWSPPLRFTPDGDIEPLTFADEWRLELA